MIGYVLLIVIAVALSIMVFAYLKLYLPKNEPQCYEDVAIALDDITCENGRIDFNIVNRGLFTVDGAYIRVGQEGRVFKKTLNEDSLFFGNNVLLPGVVWESPIYEYPDGAAGGNFELEVQPIVFIENKPALCENAVAKQKITCSTLQSS